MYRPLQHTSRFRWWESLVGRTVVLGGIALLLLVGAIVGQDTLWNRRTVSRELMERMVLVAQAKSDEVTRWVGTQADTLAVIAGSSTARRWADSVSTHTASAGEEGEVADEVARDELAHLLFTVAREYAGVREVAVLRAPNGVIVASSNAARVGEVRGGETYYVQGLQGPYAGKAQTFGATGRTLMTLSAPLYTRFGAVAGVVVMDLDVDWVQRTMLGRTGFTPSWDRYLVDRSFRLLVGPGVGSAQRPALWSGAVDLLRSGGDYQGNVVVPFHGAGIYRNHRDEEVIGAYRWIEALDLALLIEADLTETMGMRSGTMWGRSLSAGALMVGLIIAGVMLMQRGVVQPLAMLHEGMLRAASYELEGSEGTPQAPIRAAGEIKRLVGALGDMVGQQRERYAAMEARVAARTEDLRRRSLQLQAAADVSSAVAAIRDVQELLEGTVRLIPGYFDFDHVGIFLMDDRGGSVVLRAASSEGGQRMLDRGHRLLLGQGIVGTVAEEASARIALDVIEDRQGAAVAGRPVAGQPAVYVGNPDLPNTRSEMALPLIVRGRRESGMAASDGSVVLGVLDVQSNHPGAFTDEDVIVLQSVADQVALAIENARLLEESDRVLRELRLRYGEQIVAAWQRPLIMGAGAYRYTDVGLVTAVDAADSDGAFGPPVELSASAGTADASHVSAGSVRVGVEGGYELHAPIMVRGQILGSITLRQAGMNSDGQTHPNSGAPWDDEALALVGAVCNHIGEALENARLLDEAQVRAGYEQLTGDITERIRGSAVDVDEVLRTTLRELGTTLGATGTITLQPIGRAASPGSNAGHLNSAGRSGENGGRA